MNTQPHTCPCGEPKLHTVARRRTADNVSVVAWSDNTLGSRFQLSHRGTLPTEVMWAVLGEVELFDFSEVPCLVRAARELHRRGKLTAGALRTRAAKLVERRAQA